MKLLFFMSEKIFSKQFGYLRNALTSNNLHHSYIFYGERGLGKFEFAMEFARFLQCENNKGGISCEKCKNCKVSKDGFVVNTYILSKEKDESIKIDDVRELQKWEELSVAGGGRKVFIMNYAHNLTPEAREALLKTLEEPSKKSLIILLTEEKKYLPKTILSRCPAVFFPKKNEAGLDQLGNKEYIAETINQLEILLGDKVFEKMILAKELADKKNAKERMEEWILILHSILGVMSSNVKSDTNSSKILESLEKKFTYDKIVEALEKANKTLNLLDTNVSKRVLFEDFMLGL